MVYGLGPIRIELQAFFVFDIPVTMAQPEAAIVDLMFDHDLEESIELVLAWRADKIEANWDVRAAIGQLEIPWITLADDDKARVGILPGVRIRCKQLAYEDDNDYFLTHGHLLYESIRVKHLCALLAWIFHTSS
jgi:hypothetical protein